MTEEQEWCLHCGAAVGTRVVAARGWRAPIAIAGAIVAVAAIALAVAIVQLADDTERVAEAPPAAVAASPTPPAAATPVPTPDPAVTPDPALAPDATSTPAPTPSAGGSDEWPAGKSGWTVVLSSDTTRSSAESKAESFSAEGIPGVGVLDSDDFSSLRGGFWVVFAGQYDGRTAASDALDGIDASDAYIRRIVPN